MQVPEEETLAELRQRYLCTNAHAQSYVFKALRLAPTSPGGACTAWAPCGESHSCAGAAGSGVGAILLHMQNIPSNIVQYWKLWHGLIFLTSLPKMLWLFLTESRFWTSFFNVPVARRV